MTNPADGKQQEVSPFPRFIGDSLQARVGRDLSGVTQLSGAQMASVTCQVSFCQVVFAVESGNNCSLKLQVSTPPPLTLCRTKNSSCYGLSAVSAPFSAFSRQDVVLSWEPRGRVTTGDIGLSVPTPARAAAPA